MQSRYWKCVMKRISEYKGKDIEKERWYKTASSRMNKFGSCMIGERYHKLEPKGPNRMEASWFYESPINKGLVNDRSSLAEELGMIAFKQMRDHHWDDLRETYDRIQTLGLSDLVNNTETIEKLIKGAS